MSNDFQAPYSTIKNIDFRAEKSESVRNELKKVLWLQRDLRKIISIKSEMKGARNGLIYLLNLTHTWLVTYS